MPQRQATACRLNVKESPMNVSSLTRGLCSAILSLPAIGETYRVETDLERTRHGALYVDARLPA